MDCAACGTSNAATRRFCLQCGAALTNTCPGCNAPNESNARFCGSCGTALGGAATSVSATIAPVAAFPSPVAERRLVSVLFADLVGFTTLSEGRDAEEVRDLQERYFATVTDSIERYGGRVEKFIGDAVMALWGAPIAHEDDAERAVRAALDLVDAVRVLGVETPGTRRPRGRVGVLTGEAAVTLGATDQGMVAGDMVNTASRLQTAAPPGTVLVGEATQRAAAARSSSRRPATSCSRARSARSRPGGRSGSSPRAAGSVGPRRSRRRSSVATRSSASSRISSTPRAERARIRLVSVIGPAGIGKSRLAWEFLKYVDGLVEGVWWHDGRSPAYGEGITFWALGEMIRGRAHIQETDDEPTTRAAITAMLEEHVPDATERVWIEPALLSLLGLESGAGSQQLFGAWRTFFERLPEGPRRDGVRGLPPRRLRTARLRRPRDGVESPRPILIVTLARPELLERRPDWGAGKRSFASIHLEPIPIEAMRELLAGLVPGLPTTARDAIVARADGVPLYAVETVRMLLAQGRLMLEKASIARSTTWPTWRCPRR